MSVQWYGRDQEASKGPSRGMGLPAVGLVRRGERVWEPCKSLLWEGLVVAFTKTRECLKRKGLGCRMARVHSVVDSALVWWKLCADLGVLPGASG